MRLQWREKPASPPEDAGFARGSGSRDRFSRFLYILLVLGAVLLAGLIMLRFGAGMRVPGL